MTFFQIFLAYIGFAFLFFLWLLTDDDIDIRGFIDFAIMIIVVLFWPVTILWTIISIIKDKIHKS